MLNIICFPCATLLQPAEVDTVLRWVLAMLQQYATNNSWAAKLAASRTQEVQVEHGKHSTG
jgi:hypothetical protein